MPKKPNPNNKNNSGNRPPARRSRSYKNSHLSNDQPYSAEFTQKPDGSKTIKVKGVGKPNDATKLVAEMKGCFETQPPPDNGNALVIKLNWFQLLRRLVAMFSSMTTLWETYKMLKEIFGDSASGIFI